MTGEKTTVENSATVAPEKVFCPHTDIYEDGENFYIELEMPGVDEQSLYVTIEKNLLAVCGTVKAEEFPGHRQVLGEHEADGYRRTFTLPDETDREHIQATIKNGVLYMLVPKAAPATARRIEVTTG
jgi:HSP20 family molecular chaperone IbpA